MLDEWKRQTYIYAQSCRFNETRAEHQAMLARLKANIEELKMKRGGIKWLIN